MASEKSEKEEHSSDLEKTPGNIKTPKTTEGQALGKAAGKEFKKLKLGDKAGKAVVEATVAETGPLAPVLGWLAKKVVDKGGKVLVEKGVAATVDIGMKKLDEHQGKEQTHNGPLRNFTNQLIQKGAKTLQPKIEKAVANGIQSTGVNSNQSKSAAKALSSIMQKATASVTHEVQAPQSGISLEGIDSSERHEQKRKGPLGDFINHLLQKKSLQPKSDHGIGDALRMSGLNTDKLKAATKVLSGMVKGSDSRSTVEKIVTDAFQSTGVSAKTSQNAGKTASTIMDALGVGTKVRENVKLPTPAKDGTYTMKQLCECIDTPIKFNVEKNGNTYLLSVDEHHEGRAFYKSNADKFPIEIKLTANEEGYRQALNKGKIEINAYDKTRGKSGEVKEVLVQSKEREARRNSIGGH